MPNNKQVHSKMKTSSSLPPSLWLPTIFSKRICLYALAMATLPSLFAGISVVNAQVSAKNSIELLSPGGPFPVGHILFDWVDSTRGEPATSEPSDFRQVMAEIWYPARANAEGKKAAYLARLESYRPVLDERRINISASVQTSWVEGAAVNNSAPFGVLVFSHGWSSRSVSSGTFLSNLARERF